MPSTIRRRDLLGAASGLLLPTAAHAQPTAPIRELVIDRRTISIGDRPAKVYRLGPPDGGTGLVFEPGERFRVRVQNRLDEPTIIHWHGQTPPAGSDGVSRDGPTGETLIPPRGSRDYDFPARPGTHWMHAHYGVQEQRLLAAPLIMREAEAARSGAQDIILLLHDFSWREATDIMGELGGGSHAGHGSHTMRSPLPRIGGLHDLNDVIFDAFLANDRTLADPHIVRVERGAQVRLRVINAASATQFWLDLGALEGTVLASDGNPVVPAAAPPSIPLAIGQRLDFGFRMPWSGAFPVLAQVEGTAKRTGIVLATADATTIPFLDMPARQAAPAVDLSLERRITARAGLVPRPADQRQTVTLGGDMGRYVWTINDLAWPIRKPIKVRLGQRVVLDLVNTTPMSHPMHLHGHHFQIVGLGETSFSGALRDTVLVPANGKVSIAFDADNPGTWLLHCHNLYHMMAGMMTEIAYAESA